MSADARFTLSADGTKLRHPIAYPKMENDVVVGVAPLPCCGDGCLDATRTLIEQAIASQLGATGAASPR